MPLVILTWNINGIRAIKGKTTKDLLNSLEADIICLQETKVTSNMLDEPTAIVEGYDSYFSFSRKKTGYSGTANYCRTKAVPLKAEEGLTGRLSSTFKGIIECYGDIEKYSTELDALDAEGRCVITQHQIRLPDVGVKEVAIINVYVPRAGDTRERLEYKLKFLSLLQSRAEALLAQKVHVIVLGDMNLIHKSLDNCDPECSEDCNRRSSRIWMNEFLQESERDPTLPKTDSNLAELSLQNLKGGLFSDVYRRLHPDQADAFTNWNSSTGARKANYGRRLDYILVDLGLAPYVSSGKIMAEIEGSDHCPVAVTFNCDPVSSASSPQLSSKYMLRFRGQQQKLSCFFSKTARENTNYQSSQPSSLSSSSEDSQGLHSIDDQQSLTLSPPIQQQNVMHETDIKSKSLLLGQDKRKLKVATKQNAKKMKTSDVDANKKQTSLAFFMVKVSSQSNAAKVCEGTNSSQINLTEDVRSSDKQLKTNTPYKSSVQNLSLSQSLESGGLPTDNSEDPLNDIELLENHESPNSCMTDTNGNKSATSESINGISKSKSAASLGMNSSSTKDTTQAWKSILTGPAPPPLCPGHNEPCIMKTVNKKGPNKNRKFYMCARPEGTPGNPLYRCNFFKWLDNKQKR